MATRAEVEQFLKELKEKIRFFEISFHPAEFPITYPFKNV